MVLHEFRSPLLRAAEETTNCALGTCCTNRKGITASPGEFCECSSQGTCRFDGNHCNADYNEAVPLGVHDVDHDDDHEYPAEDSNTLFYIATHCSSGCCNSVWIDF